MNIFSAFPDPGLNQPPLLDEQLSNVVEWDHLSLNAVEDDTDFPGPSNAFPIIDCEAEEDTVVVFCGNQSDRKRKRAHITDYSHTDAALWSKVSLTTNKTTVIKRT